MPPAKPLGPRTKVSLQVGTIALLVAGAWKTAMYLNDFKEEQREGFRKVNVTVQEAVSMMNKRIDENARAIAGAAPDRFTGSDAYRWAIQLERANRDVQRTGGGSGLVVPDPKPAAHP